jgi:type III secretion protein T
VEDLLPRGQTLGQFGVIAVALGLSMARWLGLTVMLPVFSRTGLTGIVRGGFAFAMALPVIPLGLGAAEAVQGPGALLQIVSLALKEGAVGIGLGVILGIPIWGAEMAGELLDIQRGSTNGTLSDPQGMNQASTLGTFFAIVTVGLFLMAGGIDIVASIVYDSYRLWPLGTFIPTLSPGTGEVLVGLLQKLTLMAMTVAAPLAIVTVASDVLMGMVAKLAPQLHIDSLSAVLKSLLLAALIPLYATFFIGDLALSFGEMKTILLPMAPVAR